MDNFTCLLRYVIFAFVTTCITLISFSIYAYLNWRTPWKDHSEVFLPENVTYWEFQKSDWDRLNWKWKYTLQNKEVVGGKSLTISHRCPSLNFDADLWLGSDYVASTDAKFFSAKEKNDMMAGGDNKFGHFEFDSWWDTANSAFDLNMNVYDALGEKIADVEGYRNKWWNGYEDYLEYSDENGIIAHMVRNTWFSEWTWDIFVLENRTDVLDPRIFALMAGKISFTKNPDKMDMCNDFVQYTLIIASIIFGIFMCCCFRRGYNKCKDTYKNCKDKIKRRCWNVGKKTSKGRNCNDDGWL